MPDWRTDIAGTNNKANLGPLWLEMVRPACFASPDTPRGSHRAVRASWPRSGLLLRDGLGARSLPARVTIAVWRLPLCGPSVG